MLIDLLKNEITQDEYIRENNIRIVYKKLPKKIYGFIYRYRDINLIIINWNISKDLKKKTFIHELAHFELHHLDKNFIEFSVENVEDEADKYVNFLLDSIQEDTLK